MSDYAELLEERGWKILREIVFGDWQGDIALVMRRGSVYGFTIIGYGSCSGCDVYESRIPYTMYDYESLVDGTFTITNQEEIDKARAELAKDLDESVGVQGTQAQVIEYITDDDNLRMAYDWYRHDMGFASIIAELVMAVRTG